MNVIDLQQRTPEWHAWRNAGVTASDAAVLLGSPYKTPYRLWAEKRGLVLPEDLSGNPHVQRGIRLEPVARQAYEQRHDVLLLPLCAESSSEPVLRASFDGLSDDGRPVELKAPTAENFRDAQARTADSLLYQRYYPQLQTQIFVAEADEGVLSLFHAGEALDLPVPRDERCIDRIVDRAREFAACLAAGREPPLDPSRDLFVPDGLAQTRWQQLSAQYRRIDAACRDYRRQTKALEDQLAALERELLALMGEFLLADAEGLRIARYLQQGAIDYKAALFGLLPDLNDTVLASYRRRPSERVRITLRPESTAAESAEVSAASAPILVDGACWF